MQLSSKAPVAKETSDRVVCSREQFSFQMCLKRWCKEVNTGAGANLSIQVVSHLCSINFLTPFPKNTAYLSWPNACACWQWTEPVTDCTLQLSDQYCFARLTHPTNDYLNKSDLRHFTTMDRMNSIFHLVKTLNCFSGLAVAVQNFSNMLLRSTDGYDFALQLRTNIWTWVGHINEVTLRQARLVLGWVTVYGRVNRLGM